MKCYRTPNNSNVPFTLYRNVFSVTPRSKTKLILKILKVIRAQEGKKAAREKVKAAGEELPS